MEGCVFTQPLLKWGNNVSKAYYLKNGCLRPVRMWGLDIWVSGSCEKSKECVSCV